MSVPSLLAVGVLLVVQGHGLDINSTQIVPLVTCDPVDLHHTNPEDHCESVIPSKIAQYGVVPNGTTCLMNVNQILPTQGSVGYALAHCKTDIMESRFKMGGHWYMNYLRVNPAPGVIANAWGKDWGVYITDHHHLARAVSDAFPNTSSFEPYRIIKVCVMADFRDLNQQQFWAKMKSLRWEWNYNRYGQSVHWSKIPLSIAALPDDPFRSYSEYIRDAHGYVKCGVSGTQVFPYCNHTGEVDNRPFYEFYWANFLREHLIAYNSSMKDMYHMTWGEQVPWFNEYFNISMAFATSPVYAALDKNLSGLGRNIARKHIVQVKVNGSTGCDSLYSSLFISSGTDSKIKGKSQASSESTSSPQQSSSSHYWFAWVAVPAGLLLMALLAYFFCPKRTPQRRRTMSSKGSALAPINNPSHEPYSTFDTT